LSIAKVCNTLALKSRPCLLIAKVCNKLATKSRPCLSIANVLVCVFSIALLIKRQITGRRYITHYVRFAKHWLTKETFDNCNFDCNRTLVPLIT
jgi:hypothetical protein